MRSMRKGRTAEALEHWRAGSRTATQRRKGAAAHGLGAGDLARCGPSATAPRRWHSLSGRFELSGGKDAQALDTLAAAYAEKGQFRRRGANGAPGPKLGPHKRTSPR